MHANTVLSQDVLDYAPLFVEIADAYFELELYAEARPIYELLGTDPGVCFGRFLCLLVLWKWFQWIRPAVSTFFSRQLPAFGCSGNYEKPQTCTSMVCLCFRQGGLFTMRMCSGTVRNVDPSHNDAKMKLAEIYEILNEPRKALELVYEGI
jgi:general transcription factor 3C polypeptide 3 (transcription factor C subunit 4)